MPNDNAVMIVLRDATGVPLSYGVNSVVETGFGGKSADGTPIAKPLHKRYYKGKPVAVQPADAGFLLGLRMDVALVGGGKVTIPFFEKVSPADALASASPEDRREALDRADLKLRAAKAGVSVEAMEAAVREELVKPPTGLGEEVPQATLELMEPAAAPEPAPTKPARRKKSSARKG